MRLLFQEKNLPEKFCLDIYFLGFISAFVVQTSPLHCQPGKIPKLTAPASQSLASNAGSVSRSI